jgi:lysozyme family protein
MLSSDKIIDDIIQAEGSHYTNASADCGGPTKYGITQQTLAAWRKAPTSAQNVADLTEAEAREIYRARYITGPNFDKIADADLQELLVDSGVQFGPGDAIAWLQQAASALGSELKVDGELGSKTLSTVNAQDGSALYRRVLALRLRKRGRRITARPDQAVFAAGWLSRDAAFLER